MISILNLMLCHNEKVSYAGSYAVDRGHGCPRSTPKWIELPSKLRCTGILVKPLACAVNFFEWGTVLWTILLKVHLGV